MKAVIPAAGIGKRLRPLTYSIPKILLNVAGKPMISYLIDDLLKIRKIDKIIIIIGYLGEKVRKFIKTAYHSEKERIVLVEQKEMFGLGHAIYQTKNYLDSESLLIVLGDTIFEFDFKKFINSKCSAIGVKKVKDTSKYGIIEEKNGFIVRMFEKPLPEVTKSRQAIGGVYLLKDASKLVHSLEYIIKNNIRTKDEYQLTDALQNMISKGEKFSTYEIANWYDCGNPQSLLLTNRYMLGKNHKNSDVSNYPDMNIIPPFYIGSDCIIENSIIGPFTTLADNVIIKNSKIEGSIIHDDAIIEDSTLADSIIGPGVKIQGNHTNLYISLRSKGS